MKNSTKKRKIHTPPKKSRFPIRKIDNLISKETAEELKKEIRSFFETEIQKKIEDCPRPIKPKYSDFLERKRGRFEITPPPPLETTIWKLLLENPAFSKINKEVKDKITQNGNDCREDLCILPVEPNTKEGGWHRDVFIDSVKDFEKYPYYITQIIYLDDKANTEFCLNSQNNNHNDPSIYAKKNIRASPQSSILFDGRTLHKGMKNNTNETRYAIYISYYDSSYVDKETLNPPVLHKEKIC